MTDKPADVWRSRDYPVLLEVARRIDAGERAIPFEDVAHSLGRSANEAQLALHALKRRGLIVGIGVDVVEILRITDISAEAYLLTGLHLAGDDALTSCTASSSRPSCEQTSRACSTVSSPQSSAASAPGRPASSCASASSAPARNSELRVSTATCATVAKPHPADGATPAHPAAPQRAPPNAAPPDRPP